MDAAATPAKVDPDTYTLEEDVDLTNITPMPKHVFLNTLPGHLAPFPTIPRSRYDTDRNQREFYGQESFLNAFITTHCRDYSNSISTVGTNGTMEELQRDSDHHQQQQEGGKARGLRKPIGRNQCNLCLRTFANCASLKQHMRLHRGEKLYKCRFCDKSSVTMCNILTHERTHTRERPYKCTVCGADFSSSSNLKTHMRTHSGDRPFRCNLCDRRFVTSNALTTHLRAHWGLRLHPCPECDRQFSTSSNLRVHHRTVHLGIKQYKCNVCGKAFATSSNLNAHSRQHPDSAYRVVSYDTGAGSAAYPQTALLNHTTQETELEEENGEEAVGLMLSASSEATTPVAVATTATAATIHTPHPHLVTEPHNLFATVLSPAAAVANRKFAKVTVYQPTDGAAASADTDSPKYPLESTSQLPPDVNVNDDAK